jgi:hypothetical protein
VRVWEQGSDRGVQMEQEVTRKGQKGEHKRDRPYMKE